MACRMVIIYDVENIKVPKGGDGYRVKNVDIIKISNFIKEKYPSLYVKEVALLKVNNNINLQSFIGFLERNNILVKKREAKKKEVEGEYNGVKYTHKYEQGDMDAMIVEEIIREVGNSDHIVLLSGDGDMVSALKFAARMGVEVSVVSHEENMSNYLKIFDHTFIHEIMEK
jgi:uncharacterized LabA/DUF88 family protein